MLHLAGLTPSTFINFHYFHFEIRGREVGIPISGTDRLAVPNRILPPPLQLRYLQTLNSIAAEHNSTIIFPMPMNILDHFLNRGREKLAEKMS